MKQYIFITPEGYTYQPDSEAIEPDIENCQVLGFGKGHNADEALKNMLQEQKHLINTNFDEAIGIELKNQQKEHFYLSNLKCVKGAHNA